MKLLIGYGNTLRQDDGVGWAVAERFAPHTDDVNLRVMCVHQLMPELARSIAESTCVVFVDARLEGQAGEVCVQVLQPAEQMGDAHALHPPEILYLASYLYDKRPPAYLVTVTGEAFSLDENLSKTVAEAVPQAVDVVQKLLNTSNPTETITFITS